MCLVCVVCLVCALCGVFSMCSMCRVCSGGYVSYFSSKEFIRLGKIMILELVARSNNNN